MKLLAVVFAAALAVALTFTSAEGAGINLSWDDCGGHGAELRRFACDTNEGANILVVSFAAPAGVDSMSANEIVMDLESADATLPDWWRLRAINSPGCRAGSLVYNVDFTGGPFNCYDYWQGAASAGISEDPPIGNRARIKGLVGLPAGDPRIGPVPEGTEVYSFEAIIRNTKTTGDGACSGCGTPLCIVLGVVRLNQPQPLPTIPLYNAVYREWVGWQCGGMAPLHSGGMCAFWGCPTPTQARTWGQIKQLYR